jgi:hypothetical protein
MKKLSLFFLFSACYIIKAQTAEATAANSNRNFLLFTAAYKMPVTKDKIINSGHGFCFEAGINPAKFFGSKTVCGVYGGWSWMDRAWSTSFNNGFVNDFNQSLNKDVSLKPLDSAVVNSFQALLNTSGRALVAPGCATNSFHNYSLYYGVMFKLPFTYQPIVKLYTGYARAHMQAGNIVSDADYNIFQIRRRMYGFEFIAYSGVKLKGINGRLGVSVYGELYNFKTAVLYFDDGNQNTSVSFSGVTARTFTDKYNRCGTAGLRVCYLLNQL